MDGKGNAGQEIPAESCSVPRDPAELEIAKEEPPTENNNSIMSFFKTLVSSLISSSVLLLTLRWLLFRCFVSSKNHGCLNVTVLSGITS